MYDSGIVDQTTTKRPKTYGIATMKFILNAYHDPRNMRIQIEMADGGAFAVPAQRIPALGGLSDSELADIAIVQDGSAIWWPATNVVFKLETLLSMLAKTDDSNARAA